MLRQEEDENERTRQRKNQDTVYAGIFGGRRSFFRLMPAAVKPLIHVKFWRIQRIVRFLHSQQLLQPVLPVQALALCIIRMAV